MNPEYNKLLKCMIVGQQKSGKSCLILRYADDTFTSSHISTIGVDWKLRTEDIGSQVVKLQIWDDPRNWSRGNTLTGVQVIYIACDLTNPDALTHVKEHINSLSNIIPESAVTVVIGTKVDSAQRCISDQELKVFSELNNVAVRTCSAKTGDGIDEAFRTGAEQYLTQQQNQRNPNLSVTSKPTLGGFELPYNFSRLLPKEQFLFVYKKRLEKDQSGWLNSIFHYRKSNLNQNSSLTEIFQHALYNDKNENNRTRQVMVTLGWIDTKGRLKHNSNHEISQAFANASKVPGSQP